MNLSRDDLANRIRDICRRLPNSMNPVDHNGSCLYNGLDGTHCLIGQLIYEAGMTVGPECEQQPADEVLHALGLSTTSRHTSFCRQYPGNR